MAAIAVRHLLLTFTLVLIWSFGQVWCSNDNIQYNGTVLPQTNHSKVNLHVDQYPNMEAFMYSDSYFNVNYSIVCESPNTVYFLKIIIEDVSVAFIRNSANVRLSCAPENSSKSIGSPEMETETDYKAYGTFDMVLGTDLLGRTWMYFYLMGEGPGAFNASETLIVLQDDGLKSLEGYRLLRILITVIKPMRNLDIMFRVVIYFLIISSTIGMGCKTDLNVVKKVLKKPVAPGIGLFCQYLCMPLIAFGIAKSITFENSAVALGIFACGICPGGGISNLYCYILNGDVSLSVTMTTLSTIGALALIPFWMFTLGQMFNDDKTTISIPYLNIMTTLAIVIIPLFVGMVIKYKCLRVSKIILKVIKPVSLITIVILLTFGIYVNMYIFRLFKPLHILAGCLLPYFGYIIGGVVALIFRQPWARVKTIAIETGIQNVGVAFLMLLTSLPPPDGDLAAVGPAASAIMTPLPLFVISIIYVIYNKCREKKYESVPIKNKNAQTEINGNRARAVTQFIMNENVSTV